MLAIIDSLHKKLTVLVQHHVSLKSDELCHAEDGFQSYIQRISRNIITSYGTVVIKEEC